jgi:phospholipid/cholesterol/gamma-HCH transport system ATP-binding protein
MKKRVGLARAIVEGAPLILFDEPTTGLDPVTVSGVNELIREMQRRLKITSIVITHDLDSAAKIGDRIAMLYRGRIVACGTMDQLHASTHPAVRQLLTGATRGPLTDDYINRGIVPTE